jgi:hypothetical protein
MRRGNSDRVNRRHLVYDWIIPLGMVAVGVTGVLRVAGHRETGAEVSGPPLPGRTSITWTAPPRPLPLQIAQGGSEARARGVALATAPGATVVQINTDREGGRTVWEVHLSYHHGSPHEVDVDAGSGKVLPPGNADKPDATSTALHQ